MEKAGKIVSNSIGMQLAAIPPGEFLMGGHEPPNELLRVFDFEPKMVRDEFPQHPVRINRPFWLGVYPVTVREYRQVMGTVPRLLQGFLGLFGEVRLPVTNVTWDEAQEFCRRLSELPVEKAADHVYRLPTEAEWEYACRAGTTTRFSFGDDPAKLGGYAWWSENAGKKAHPVGQKKPNSWSLFDMHGNVWEWCGDWHARGYYSRSPRDDPPGPHSGENRVVRGGSWHSINPGYFRSASRAHYLPDRRLSYVGLRVARVATFRVHGVRAAG